MSRFVPYEKLSKKQKKEIDKLRRNTWGEMSPVTRKAEKSNIYNRKKHRCWMEETDGGVFCMLKSAC